MKHIYNCFGECIDNVELSPQNVKFPKPSKDIDDDGFDLRNVEENGEPIIDYELKKGTIISRFGPEGGRFSAPVGTPYEERGLPYDKRTCEYHEYIVIADGVTVSLVVKKGVTAPAFDSKGGGVQYKHHVSISDEIRSGKLKEVTTWLTEK